MTNTKRFVDATRESITKLGFFWQLLNKLWTAYTAPASRLGTLYLQRNKLEVRLPIPSQGGDATNVMQQQEDDSNLIDWTNVQEEKYSRTTQPKV